MLGLIGRRRKSRTCRWMMNLYIPVEVKNRELAAKLLLAKQAAEYGFNVILGRKNDLNELVEYMPPGIYLGLGAFANFRSFFARLKGKGFAIAVNEEEGLVTYSDAMYIDMRVSRETLEEIDELLTWGEENQRVLTGAFPGLADRFRITGNPRFDLLKPAYQNVYAPEVARIQERYGRYVLVCTSFSAINHFDPTLDYLGSLIEKKTLRSEESIENFKRYCEVKKTVLEGVLEAIPRLAAIDESVDIVVRPHPSENKELYKEFEHRFRNVHVDARFSVHPWIIGADALVHHYCTTSIEALAAGTPRFALRTARDPLSEKEIPFACSEECETVDELVARVAGSLRRGRDEVGDATLREEYSCYVSNIAGRSAVEAIVDELARLAADKGFDRGSNGPLATNLKAPVAVARHIAKQSLRSLLRRNRKTVDYINHKFADLSLDEVRDTIAAYGGDAGLLEIRGFAGKLVNLRRTRERS